MPSRRFGSVGGDSLGACLPRHRIVVLASAVAPVVGSVGGFLCDRARQGWDVSVLLTRPADTGPLAILGVSTRPPDADLEADIDTVVGEIPAGATLAVEAGMFDSDACVRHNVAKIATQGRVTVAVWGRPAAPAELRHGFEPVAHQPSAAAAAFKTHALRAVSTAEGAGTEMLYRLRAGSFRHLHPA
ncbi:hypothetical protein [Mycobacterium sp. NAZ190054]|uniref:hypothetical protein n=1 Tax=Mycobacterium sp. NAZ190054 TaxID=1747766 RepID=UPI000793760A|nr:hypothetical protein [Mycobacterium sp. NAZ190054]KWX68455.1 hypothetical protein ASJ79_17735 [Mycobacterium sp. NAZ190054]